MAIFPHAIKVEGALALTSVAIGLTGAVLLQPIILGVAAISAVLATSIRLADRAQQSHANRPSTPVVTKISER
jgi:hypothetical protein